MKRIRIFGVLLSLVLIAALVFTGCAKEVTPPPAPPPPPPVTPPPAPPPAPPAPKFEEHSFQYANPMPEAAHEAWEFTWKVFGEKMSEITDGAWTLVPQHGGALLTNMEIPDGLSAGLADFAYIPAGYFPSKFPSFLPGGIIDPLISLKQDVYHWGLISSIATMEYMPKEFALQGIKLLYTTTSANQVLGTKTAVWDVDDLAGMKLRTYGGEYQMKLYEAMGAVGVQIPFIEYPESIQRGIVQGNLMPIGLFNQLQVTMETPYYLTNAEGSKGFHIYQFGAGYTHGMNGALWASLTDEEKLVVLQAAKAAEEVMNNSWGPYNDDQMQLALDMGAEYTWLPAEDIATLMQHPVVANIWWDVAAQIDEAGGPGTAMITRMMELTDMSPAEIEKIYEDQWAQRFAELW